MNAIRKTLSDKDESELRLSVARALWISEKADTSHTKEQLSEEFKANRDEKIKSALRFLKHLNALGYDVTKA